MTLSVLARFLGGGPAPAVPEQNDAAAELVAVTATAAAAAPLVTMAAVGELALPNFDDDDAQLDGKNDDDAVAVAAASRVSTGRLAAPAKLPPTLGAGG